MVLHGADDADPISHRGDVITVPGQKIGRSHLERLRRQGAPPPEVRQHGLDSLVVAGDRVTTGNVPADVTVEQVTQVLLDRRSDVEGGCDVTVCTAAPST